MKWQKSQKEIAGFSSVERNKKQGQSSTLQWAKGVLYPGSRYLGIPMLCAKQNPL